MVCEICGSGLRVSNYHGGKSLCNRHRNHMDKYGKIITVTKNDRNIITEHENHAEIFLFDRKHNIKAVALISKWNIFKVSPYKWSMNRKGYAMAKVEGKSILLHKFLLPTMKGMLVDHINQNKLDCRDENLREATPSQNCHNSKINSNNTSGIKGVRYIKKSGKWSAEINFEGVRYRKAGIPTKDEAIKRLNEFKKAIKEE